MLRILTFSTLYPNAIQPTNGVFVENRLRHLVANSDVSSCVVAPVPWFPFKSRSFGRYSALARVPHHEQRHDIPIYHPRYPVIPKVGMSIAPLLLYAAVKPIVARIARADHDFDIIDAHYFYPDGVAAVLLARALGKAVSITARGTDLNLISTFNIPRRQIVWAATRADALITVTEALKDKLVGLGIDASRVNVLRNGVDLGLFQPIDRVAERGRLGLDHQTLLSVGNLVPLKGHDIVIRALSKLTDKFLLIVGDGPERSRLEQLAKRLNVKDRVRFLGQVRHEQLPRIYGAADALVLASSREGWANVLLESMACGTPVVATNVGGNPEVIADEAAGVLMKERTVEALVDAIRRLFSDMPRREATRAYAENFNWDSPTQGQIEIFTNLRSTR